MSEQKLDVVGLGNALVDVVTNVHEAFIAANGLNKGAMTLIDAARAIELYKVMPAAKESSGGSGANTIAALASLGSRTGFVGRIGKDSLGDVFAHDIRAQGVVFGDAGRDATEPTGRCLIVVTPDAERTMNTSLAANVNFSVADLPKELIQSAKVVYLEGYLYDQPAAKAAFEQAAAWAREAGNEVALTLSDSFCVQRHRDDFRKLVKNVDILFANEHEIMALYEVTDFESAAKLAASEVKLAVLTRSAKGAAIITKGQDVVIAAEPVAKVVDLTGAGDAFAAGFLHGYTSGMSLAESGRIAALCASEVISHFGARPEVKLSDFVAQRKAA